MLRNYTTKEILNHLFRLTRSVFNSVKGQVIRCGLNDCIAGGFDFNKSFKMIVAGFPRHPCNFQTLRSVKLDHLVVEPKH